MQTNGPNPLILMLVFSVPRFKALDTSGVVQHSTDIRFDQQTAITQLTSSKPPHQTAAENETRNGQPGTYREDMSSSIDHVTAQLESWIATPLQNLTQASFAGLYNNAFPQKSSSSQSNATNLKLLQDSLYKVRTNLSSASASNYVTVIIWLAKEICKQRSRLWTAESSEEENSKHCPFYFDGLSCWQSAPSGSLVSLPCPAFVPWASKTGTVHIGCSKNNTWNSSLSICEVYGHCFPKNDCLERVAQLASGKQRNNFFGSALNALRYITVGGYTISILATSVALMVFLCLRRLSCPRNVVHANLFGAFWFKALLSIIQYTVLLEPVVRIAAQRNSWFCKAFTTVWTYSNIASFMWMTVEALYLHNIIFFNVFSEPAVKPYIALGWGCPTIALVAWISTRWLADTTVCWTSNNNQLVWIARGPIVLSFGINFCLFINIIRELFVKLSDSSNGDAHKYKKMAKSTGILSLLCGLHYLILTFPMSLADARQMTTPLLVTIYIESILTSLQGLFATVIYCFMSTEIRKEVFRKLEVWRQKRDVALTQRRHSTQQTFTTLATTPNSFRDLKQFDTVCSNGDGLNLVVATPRGFFTKLVPNSARSADGRSIKPNLKKSPLSNCPSRQNKEEDTHLLKVVPKSGSRDSQTSYLTTSSSNGD